MEKTITIDNKQIRFKANGATPLRFKAQFGKDYFKEILKLLPMQSLAGKKPEEINIEDLESLDFEIFYNLAWILAKTADPSIPEPIAWLEQFEEFPMVEIIPDLQEIITSSFSQLKKKVNDSADGEEITTELFQVLCYQCQLTKSDLEIMTIGNCLDYIEEFIESQKPPKERKRKATQNDFDSF